MATMSLKVVEDPNTAASLQLGDILAKGIFGDPEAQMKAKALGAEVGLRMASRDKEIADTGLITIKTKQEQALADAQDRAANAGPLVANAAVPDLVPVEAPRPSLAAGGYGPQPAIVSPQEQRMHDAIIAQNNANWPAIVRGSTGPQLVKAPGELAGASVLEGGLVPGSRPDPNTLRIAGGLYSGTAPSETTVWSPTDTAGVDAAARKTIAIDAAKPKEPNIKEFGGMPYLIRADGSLVPAQGFQPTSKAPEHMTDAAGNNLDWDPASRRWIPSPGASPALPKAPEHMTDAAGNNLDWDPTTRQWIKAPGAAAPPAKLVDVGPNAMLPPSTPDGVYRTPKTDKPVVVAGPYDDLNSDSGRNNKTIRDTMTLASQPVDPLRPSPITPAMARDYDQAYTSLYGAKTTIQKIPDANGNPVDTPVTIYPDRPGFLSPTEMYKRANVAPPIVLPPGPAQAASGQPPVAPAPTPAPTAAAPGPNGAVVVGQPIGSPQPAKPTEAQLKARSFIPTLQTATATLDKFNKDNLPNNWELGYVTPSEELGTVSRMVESSPLISDNARRYGAAAEQWTSAQLYDLSGAAIGKGEFDRSVRGFLPRPSDPPDLIATKTKLRHDFLNTVANSGYSNDPKVLALLAQGKALNPDGSAAGPSGGAASSASPAPPDIPPEITDPKQRLAWPTLPDDVKTRLLNNARKRK